MFGELIRYAANRAVDGAVDSAARHASWAAAALFLLGVGAVFTLIVVFWLLEAHYGATAAGMAIASFCLVTGLLSLMMPRFLDWLEARAKATAQAQTDPLSNTVAAVQEEVAGAVDYFGPIRVVASSVMLGVGLARSIKR